MPFAIPCALSLSTKFVRLQIDALVHLHEVEKQLCVLSNLSCCERVRIEKDIQMPSGVDSTDSVLPEELQRLCA